MKINTCIKFSSATYVSTHGELCYSSTKVLFFIVYNIAILHELV